MAHLHGSREEEGAGESKCQEMARSKAHSLNNTEFIHYGQQRGSAMQCLPVSDALDGCGRSSKARNVLSAQGNGWGAAMPAAARC